MAKVPTLFFCFSLEIDLTWENLKERLSEGLGSQEVETLSRQD